jgi:methionine-rich copper-binding protein CopC
MNSKGAFTMKPSVLFAACAVLAAGPACAHAFLKTATPAVGSTVQQPPSQVVIDFTEGVEPKFSTITVQDAAGAEVGTGDAHLQGGNTHLALAVKTLPAGTYKVTWHATAVDTHKTEGSFTFTVSQ